MSYNKSLQRAEEAAFILDKEFGRPATSKRNPSRLTRSWDVAGLGHNMISLLMVYTPPGKEPKRPNTSLDLANGEAGFRVQTSDPRGTMALRELHRPSGLVVVNQFPFDPNEVRRLETAEDPDLDRTMTVQGHGLRVLTEVGIEHLTSDLDFALAALRSRVE